MLAAHQHPAAVQGVAPGVVDQLPCQHGLSGPGYALAEQHLADEGQFTDRLEAFQEADLRIDVQLQPESLAVGVQPLQGSDADLVDETRVGHPGTPCPSAARSRSRVSAAAKAVIRVEW